MPSQHSGFGTVVLGHILAYDSRVWHRLPELASGLSPATCRIAADRQSAPGCGQPISCLLFASGVPPVGPPLKSEVGRAERSRSNRVVRPTRPLPERGIDLFRARTQYPPDERGGLVQSKPPHGRRSREGDSSDACASPIIHRHRTGSRVVGGRIYAISRVRLAMRRETRNYLVSRLRLRWSEGHSLRRVVQQHMDARQRFPRR